MLVVRASIRPKFDSSRDPHLFFGQPLAWWETGRMWSRKFFYRSSQAGGATCFELFSISVMYLSTNLKYQLKSHRLLFFFDSSIDKRPFFNDKIPCKKRSRIDDGIIYALEWGQKKRFRTLHVCYKVVIK
jgi:hypothetical protein